VTGSSRTTFLAVRRGERGVLDEPDAHCDGLAALLEMGDEPLGDLHCVIEIAVGQDGAELVATPPARLR